ncbi:MAG: OmpA family protein [Flavobacteriaceae bacterium]|nr:OmpA family protein [Flavobacteriaceae bacterium]
MKVHYYIVLLSFFLLAIPNTANAQFFKKMMENAENKIEREAEKRSERRVNKGIDNTFDAVEDEIDGKSKKESNTKTSKKEKASKTAAKEDEEEITTTSPNVVWSQFDFIPGDTVIFEDGPSTDEENGEFPSRWDLKEGNAEIAEVDGVNVIVFPHGGVIIPYLKNPEESYLPDVFTIEFDAYFSKDNEHRFWISFYDEKNQSRIDNAQQVTFYPDGVSFENSRGEYPKKLSASGWRHFSVAFTKGKLKVYLDDTRLINLPHVKLKPTGITFENDGYGADKTFQYMKNFRIAKGGVKYYDRVLSEGKIIVNGIKFDVNKATLKPESMGPINKIYKLMDKNPELNFSVEGHTDSDGNDENNMKLSKGRGKTVMNKLIAMGIASSRLKSTGFGESKPLDNNSTPEGKANNRRVEFVKF